ncbi:MAG: FAD-dependent oxidoreductase [Clostridia bacterium]|nr:FAD-dependent oxidoreductase [Clostridia bacterium]
MILSTFENGKVVKSIVTEHKFDLKCDVLVVGAGSAGVYAADAAAKNGADVILCEIGENIGGMHICGSVTGYYYGMKGGTFEEDDEKNKNDTIFFHNGIQWEQRQIRVIERLIKSGVKILCRHSATGLLLNDNRITGIRAFNGKTIIDIGAKITIDATSDGHLLRMTDVPKKYGKENEGVYVPFTTRTQYTNDGKLYSCNTDSGLMNHYDAVDFSKQTIASHSVASQLIKEGEFVNVALQVGIREGLTFEGEETLNYRDVVYSNHPKKILFWAYSDFDRHGYERALDEELFQNWWVISNLATVIITIAVPFGSVVPKGIKGLVTAGRCLSCDSYTHSAVRMNRDMFRMGECVGTAAALAVKSDVDFMDIDYEKFCELTDNGCHNGVLPHGFYFDNNYRVYLQKMKSLNRTPDPKYSHLRPNDRIRESLEFKTDKTLHLLKTDAPGPALWSCYIAKDKKEISDKLYDMMTDNPDLLHRYNCAIALGLVGDKRAIPVLREIIDNRDCFFFTDNRRSNQFRSVVAVCLMGRLGSEDDLPLLYEILKDEEWEKPMYHTLPHNYLYHPYPDRNFVYFSMITHLCVAIYKIYQRNNLPLADLNEIFSKFFEGDKVFRRLTQTNKGKPAYEEIKNYINTILKLTNI